MRYAITTSPPRIIAELVFHIFGIPMISYSDDFGALLPAELAQQGLETFAKWCNLLGIPLKLKNRKLGHRARP